ncbi:MAG: ABC transporter permease [Firmicutes bacterium]|nr:ABC transporter permease [Bacillota bacterium]
MRALWSQWKMDMLRTVRDRRVFLLTMGMPIAFYFIFIDETNPHLSASAPFWKGYFMVSMAAFGVVGSAVNTLGVRLAAERKSGWVRWLKTTPLSPVAYALSKILTQLVLSLLIVAAIFAVAHFDQGVTLKGEKWAEILGWLWIGSIPFAALGVVIGFFGNAAQILGTLVYLTLSFLGGLWTPISAMPSPLQPVARLMPTYRFAAPAWAILENKPVAINDVLILGVYAVLFTGLAALVQKWQDARPDL